jgi:hypothetical protein
VRQGFAGMVFANRDVLPKASCVRARPQFCAWIAHERLASAMKEDAEERKRADEIIRKYKESLKQVAIPKAEDLDGTDVDA